MEAPCLRVRTRRGSRGPAGSSRFAEEVRPRRPPDAQDLHTGTARMSTSVQADAQAQQPDAAPHCKAPPEVARKAKPAARRGGLRPGAVPPSAWDLRGVAVYAAFLAAAGAYFWLRVEGVCAMGPYAWCASILACHGVLGGRLLRCGAKPQ